MEGGVEPPHSRVEIQEFGEHGLRHGGLHPQGGERFRVDLRWLFGNLDRPQREFAMDVSDPFFQAMLQSFKQPLSTFGGHLNGMLSMRAGLAQSSTRSRRRLEPLGRVRLNADFARLAAIRRM